MMFSTGTSASTCTTPGSQKPFTIADLEQAAAVVALMGPEPIGEWMRSKGCPPEQWDLILPWATYDDYGRYLLPNYVRRSTAVAAPVFLRKGAYAP